MDKKCCSCHQTKEVSEFSVNRSRKDGYNSWCKECTRKYDKKRYQQPVEKRRHREKNKTRANRNRVYVYNYLLTHPCVICGESDPACLDFHHKCNDTKSYTIGDMVRGYGLKTIQSEIDKCEVLCANCHRKKTAKEEGWYVNARALG